MRTTFMSVMMASILLFAACGKADVGELLEQYLWEKRVLMVFTPSQTDQAFKTQFEDYLASQEGYNERDMVVFSIIGQEKVFKNEEQLPQLPTRPFRRYFDVAEEEFTVILIGKDGLTKVKDNQPLLHERLFEIIDAMPLRRQMSF